MKTRTKLALGALATVVVGLAVLSVDIYLHPMTRGMALQRTALGFALTRGEIAGPTGPVTVFRGGTGPNLVFIHGFADHAGTWYQVAPAFTADWHVVVVDLPGHGESPSGDDLSMEQVRGGLDAVLATLDGPAVLVGNSLGGWLSMLEALDHPERVSRMVLVNAAGLKWPIDGATLMPATREEARLKTAALGVNTPVWGALLDQTVSLTTPTRYHALFASVQTAHVDDRLPTLRVPADLLWGSNDGFFPLEYAERLHAALPASRLRVLSDACGHGPQLFCAPELVTALTETLASEPPPLPPDLTWLLGCWQTVEGDSRECWGWADGRFLGTTIAGGEVVETMSIEPGETAWRYVASPRGQAMAAFTLTGLEGRAAVFENPGHDFPTRIAYERDGTVLRAEVTGATDGFVVDMRRVMD